MEYKMLKMYLYNPKEFFSSEENGWNTVIEISDIVEGYTESDDPRVLLKKNWKNESFRALIRHISGDERWKKYKRKTKEF